MSAELTVRPVYQELNNNPLADISAEIERQFESLECSVPQGDVAITAGSRGISNIVEITKAVGDALRRRGAKPFIVPAMGSHNGATAIGQQQMIESLGITEAACGMEIRSSMDVVTLGEVASGPVFMDKHCFESAGVFVLNRVKLHTCFSGPVQSGLTKMMVVGMGKIRSAETFHSTPPHQMKDMLLEMGSLILNSGRVLGGLAILEDGFDQTAELHAIRAEDILKEEPKLLERHRAYFPGLPLDDLNVLIVEEIGKTYSGTGMDTNVIGYRGVKGFEDLERPNIRTIGVLGLSKMTQGNAIGVGLADFITRRCRDAIDEDKTRINVLTTGDMGRGKIPCTLDDDKTLIETIRQRFGEKRWMFIPNTLHLEHVFVSEDLTEEVVANSACKVSQDAIALPFADGRLRLPFPAN